VAVGSGWTMALVIAVGAGGMLAAALSLALPPGEPEQAERRIAPPVKTSHRMFRIIGNSPRKTVARLFRGWAMLGQASSVGHPELR
jgi:hypothetical protein